MGLAIFAGLAAIIVYAFRQGMRVKPTKTKIPMIGHVLPAGAMVAISVRRPGPKRKVKQLSGSRISSLFPNDYLQRWSVSLGSHDGRL